MWCRGLRPESLMSRTYAAIAPSSSPESATILERALETCPSVGSETGNVQFLAHFDSGIASR